jgi:hypothetical protein
LQGSPQKVLLRLARLEVTITSDSENEENEESGGDADPMNFFPANKSAEINALQAKLRKRYHVPSASSCHLLRVILLSNGDMSNVVGDRSFSRL